jgi:ATP-binding cassette subfamily B protein
MLLGFYEPTEGEISLGDQRLATIHARAWRNTCGVVMQDGFIFSGTIAGNIALSDEYPDMHRLVGATETANIREFIEALPLGYNTRIGQDGLGLSQGQKQRILIARAIYKDPGFVFLDEATNALDATNEKVIMDKLSAFFPGRTVVIVAHRLSTVMNAGQIIVLDKGSIAERGTHEELVQKRGQYYQLVRNQLELGT